MFIRTLLRVVLLRRLGLEILNRDIEQCFLPDTMGPNLCRKNYLKNVYKFDRELACVGSQI